MPELERVEIAAADDHAGRDQLQLVLSRLGYLGNSDELDVEIGSGLSRFRRGEVEVTVFADAWVVDLVAPPDAMREILATLAGGDYDEPHALPRIPR